MEKQESKFDMGTKNPEELKIVRNSDNETFKVFIDDIEIPFACQVSVTNNIEVNHPGPFEILAGRPARDVKYLQGPIDITVTIRPKRIAIQNE